MLETFLVLIRHSIGTNKSTSFIVTSAIFMPSAYGKWRKGKKKVEKVLLLKNFYR